MMHKIIDIILLDFRILNEFLDTDKESVYFAISKMEPPLFFDDKVINFKEIVSIVFDHLITKNLKLN
jgi:hypothetical protein